MRQRRFRWDHSLNHKEYVHVPWITPFHFGYLFSQGGTYTPVPRDGYPLTEGRVPISSWTTDGPPIVGGTGDTFRVGRVALIRGTDKPFPRVGHPFFLSPGCPGNPCSEGRVPSSDGRVPLGRSPATSFPGYGRPRFEGRVPFSGVRGTHFPRGGYAV